MRRDRDRARDRNAGPVSADGSAMCMLPLLSSMPVVVLLVGAVHRAGHGEEDQDLPANHVFDFRRSPGGGHSVLPAVPHEGPEGIRNVFV